MQSLGNGKYEIIERLGRGGMAEVYRAYQSNLDRFVAIKVLHPFLADDPEFKSRFEKEARNIAKLKHPNVVQVYDFENEQDNESYYMVMELVDGPTLKEVMAKLTDDGQVMPVPEAIRIIREAAGALSYAHALNMIHRDVKPANLMLDKNNRVVLTDFGIAKIVTGVQFTSSGGMVGTPAYMAPEQGLGEQGDERSDLYSLGVIFYQLLTGRLPYDGDTPLAVILKHLNEPVRSPREYRPDLPEALDQIITRLMAKDPADRYQTATELIADLDRFEGRGTMEGDSGSFQGVPVSAYAGESDTLALPKTGVHKASAAARTHATTGGTSVRSTQPPVLTARPAPRGITTTGTVTEQPVRRRRSMPIWLWVLLSALVGVGMYALVFGSLGRPLLELFASATPTASQTAAVVAAATTQAPSPTKVTVTPTITPSFTPTPSPSVTASFTPAPTQTAAVLVVTATPQPPTATHTPSPTSTPRPTSTPSPTRTPRPPTATPTPNIPPTATVNLTATAETFCSYEYEIASLRLFREDGGEVLDGAIQAGTRFTLEFELRNTGTCAWNINWTIRYERGEDFNTLQPFIIQNRVQTFGGSYRFVFQGIAPSENGPAVGYWRMRTPTDFPIGVDPLEVRITVWGA